MSPDENEVERALGVLFDAAEVLDAVDEVQALVAATADRFGFPVDRCPDTFPADWT